MPGPLHSVGEQLRGSRYQRQTADKEQGGHGRASPGEEGSTPAPAITCPAGAVAGAHESVGRAAHPVGAEAHHLTHGHRLDAVDRGRAAAAATASRIRSRHQGKRVAAAGRDRRGGSPGLDAAARPPPADLAKVDRVTRGAQPLPRVDADQAEGAEGVARLFLGLPAGGVGGILAGLAVAPGQLPSGGPGAELEEHPPAIEERRAGPCPPARLGPDGHGGEPVTGGAVAGRGCERIGPGLPPAHGDVGARVRRGQPSRRPAPGPVNRRGRGGVAWPAGRGGGARRRRWSPALVACASSSAVSPSTTSRWALRKWVAASGGTTSPTWRAASSKNRRDGRCCQPVSESLRAPSLMSGCP